MMHDHPPLRFKTLPAPNPSNDGDGTGRLKLHFSPALGRRLLSELWCVRIPEGFPVV